MERNLTLYPYFQACQNLMFWQPIFFLYFASVLPIHEAVLLEAIYYLAVVVLEVPSGYFSDRFGRRLTLLASSAGWFSACTVFVLTQTFESFCFAQILLAAGMAFRSGTDSSLLYESLTALGRGSEIGQREVSAQRVVLLSLATSAFLGGALAGFDLRFAYALSALSGLTAIVIAWQFVETQDGASMAPGPLRQVRVVVGQLRDPVLRWALLFAVLLIVLAHVPYEFVQLYLRLLFNSAGSISYDLTPLSSGILIAATMVVAALIGAKSLSLAKRMGFGALCLSAVLIELMIIAAMGSVVHASVIVLLLFRSAPMALVTPVMNAVLHARLPNRIRATYFSMQSLAGRLAFSITLALASTALGDTVSPSLDGLSIVTNGYLLGALLLCPVMLVAATRLSRVDTRMQVRSS